MWGTATLTSRGATGKSLRSESSGDRRELASHHPGQCSQLPGAAGSGASSGAYVRSWSSSSCNKNRGGCGEPQLLLTEGCEVGTPVPKIVLEDIFQGTEFYPETVMVHFPDISLDDLFVVVNEGLDVAEELQFHHVIRIEEVVGNFQTFLKLSADRNFQFI